MHTFLFHILFYNLFLIGKLLQDTTPLPLDLGALVSLVATLGGFSALAAALNNVLKYINVVPDGSAPKVSLVINFVLLGGTIVAALLGKDIGPYDKLAGSVAGALVLVVQLLGQLVLTAKWHEGLKDAGVPVIGFSNSVKLQKLRQASMAESPGPVTKKL